MWTIERVQLALRSAGLDVAILTREGGAWVQERVEVQAEGWTDAILVKDVGRGCLTATVSLTTIAHALETHKPILVHLT